METGAEPALRRTALDRLQEALATSCGRDDQVGGKLACDVEDLLDNVSTAMHLCHRACLAGRWHEAWHLGLLTDVEENDFLAGHGSGL